MKLKSIFQLMGIKGRSKRYRYQIVDFKLSGGMNVRYAQWQHPGESEKKINDEMVQAYKEIIKPGDFCIDIGAHSGDSTLPMAISAGPDGCTLALEPNPYVFHVLDKNARANRHIANIRPIMAAATPEEGFLQFEYSDSGFCNGGRHENISVLRHGHTYKLDVFGINLESELRSDYRDLLPKFKFLKVDAEGYDLFVLQSLAGIIIEFKPIIKTEVFKKTSTAYRLELFSFFYDNGYSIYKIDKEPIGKGMRLDLTNVDDWRHYDLICYPLTEQN